MPTRREFVKVTAMAGAAVAIVGAEALASAPDWIDFRILKGPFAGDHFIYGWIARWHDGFDYGTSTWITEPQLAEARTLMQADADYTKRELLKLRGWHRTGFIDGSHMSLRQVRRA